MDIGKFNINSITVRDRWIGKTSGKSVEGGALKANYRTVEAVAMICNHMGKLGLIYGEDFTWDGVDAQGNVVIQYKKGHSSLLDNIKWS